MTRETKIGLLVGLAFIIVVGILLSEPLSHSNEAQPAQLPVVGANVRAGVTTPGSGQPPISVVDPSTVSPRQTVPTQHEIAGRSSNGGGGGVIVIGPPGGQNGSGGRTEIGITQSDPPYTPPSGNDGNRRNEYVQSNNGNRGVTVENGEHARGSIDGGSSLSNAGRTRQPDARDSGVPGDLIHEGLRGGEEIVPVNGSGRGQNGNTGNRQGNPLPAGSKQYTAGAGDNLSKIATKAYGSSTKANRDAIVQANPSLQQDANKIIAGRTYVIPNLSSSASPAPPVSHEVPLPPRVVASNPPANSNAPAPAGYVYTVKESDSLWKIARDQCGDAGAVAAIKELNKEVLGNSDQVRPNMKLRLPAKVGT